MPYKVRFFVNHCISVQSTTYFDISCRLFWVTWAGSKIRVGTGATVIMEYQDPSPLAIKSVAVSTGWGSSGSWKVYDQSGKLKVYTCYSNWKAMHSQSKSVCCVFLRKDSSPTVGDFILDVKFEKGLQRSFCLNCQTCWSHGVVLSNHICEPNIIIIVEQLKVVMSQEEKR